MSILIKGMEMPKDGAERCIVIRGDGKIRTFTGAPIDYATAIPVPPHGRLIDAIYVRDAIIQAWVDKADDSHMYKRGMEDAYEVIRNAPTIIEAEGEDNG